MSQNSTDKLLKIMSQLRDPKSGCPWDIKQSFATIAPYTIEEAYEVVDAIEKNDMEALKEELGDLLLQVVFHSQMAKEKNLFDFNQVVDAIVEKLIRRHPNIFANAEKIKTAEDQKAAWESYKEAERKQSKQQSALDGVAQALPALSRALKLQDRAAQVGFDWPSLEPVFAKLEEELKELLCEISQQGSLERISEELGDILFVCANIARHLKVDPEFALRQANQKFEKRFHRIEELLAEQSKTPQQSNLEEMDKLWDIAKKEGL